MTDTPLAANQGTPDASDAAAKAARHSTLIAATRATIDALAVLSLESSPQAFPALKARHLDRSGA